MRSPRASGRAAPLCMDGLPGVPIAGLAAFEGCGLDYVFSSLPWWDGRADWFWREDAALRRIAPVIAPAEAPFGARLGEQIHDPATRLAMLRRGLDLAALLGSGWMMVMGSEYGAMRRLDPRRDEADDFALTQTEAAEHARLPALITTLNDARANTPALSGNGPSRLLSGPGAPLLTVARAVAADTRLPGEIAVVTLNMALRGDPLAEGDGVYAGLGGYHVIELPTELPQLAPGDYRIATLEWHSPEGPPQHGLDMAARQAARAPRIAIEAVTPSVDGGTFAARYCVGDSVAVEADIICDGHDMLAAEIRWQGPGDDTARWRRVRMTPLGNDRWSATFPLLSLGVHRFTVEAWKDAYATYRDELSKKFAAGLDVSLEVREGQLLVAEYARQAGTKTRDLHAICEQVSEGAAIEDKVALLLSDDTAALLRSVDPRAFATWIEPALPVEAERTAAKFASWYELFPRSMSGDPDRHGTFDDVIAHLPRIQAMGFDVLYFPPIHPIGVAHRKGRNNALVAAPDDPGSPYGIADHTAIHPQLGTFDDFRRLRDAALAHGLELALDFAVQCSPDHPWLAAHKGWFDWRPDGSIRYAENPPKKYQDIVNVDFYKDEAIDGLWRSLCEVVLFWCEQGIRIFRVDNPHTKPLPFWQWMIGTVQARHPDTLFLAEAFTKPKMMNRLAKVGFSQSYTYFTWRNTKAELQDYLIELNSTAAKDFFRPNFFVNTPDINPVFLQESGRPGHLIRAALAATLAGLWGMYSGFELCDARPLPGREEYLDSEKYQIRVWDWNKPGNIVREVTQLNWMRRLNPALQTHLGVRFLSATNDNILYFEKATPDRSNVVLVAINLDPYHAQAANLEVPLWRWKLPDHASVEVDDLVLETSYQWNGKIQHVRLDPASNPYAVWRVRPAGGAVI